MRLIKYCAAAVLAVSTLTAFSWASPAAATEWPSKPITLLVGFSAGGGADTMARLMARALEQDLGQPVVVDNKAGGGGVVMATLLQRAPADGYTIGFTTDSTFDALPFIVRIAYHPDDFDYLATVAELQNALVTGADAPFSTWEGMLAYAREEGSLTFGSPSPITTKFASRLAKKEGIQVRTVPIKGGREIITNVMGRHLDVGWSAGVHQAYLNDQGVKVLVAMNDEPLRTSPEVPTIAAHGYDRTYTSYFMLAAPKGVPEKVHGKLVAAIRRAATSEDVVDLVEEKMKFPSVVLPPDQLTRFIKKRSAVNKHEFSEQ